MYSGIVIAINSLQGSGFIRREKGKDVFFKSSDFTNPNDFYLIEVNTAVNFEVVESGKFKNRAANISVA